MLETDRQIESLEYLSGTAEQVKSAFLRVAAEVEPHLGHAGASGALFDLGVSSPQLDRPERGFSFPSRGPLALRIDPTRPLTAADLVNAAPHAELVRLLNRRAAQALEIGRLKSLLQMEIYQPAREEAVLRAGVDDRERRHIERRVLTRDRDVRDDDVVRRHDADVVQADGRRVGHRDEVDVRAAVVVGVEPLAHLVVEVGLAGLVGRGAEGVILGCTEISMLVRPGDASVPLLDTTEIHARRAALWALAEERSS